MTTLRLSFLFIAGLLLSIFGGSAAELVNDDQSQAQRAETLRRYGFAPTSLLEE